MKPDVPFHNILPNVWLGDETAQYLLNPKVCFNLYGRDKRPHATLPTIAVRRHDSDMLEYHFPLRDVYACAWDMTPAYEALAAIMHQHLRDGDRVLVYCKRGHTRSAGLILYYLMKYAHFDSLEAARHYVQTRRPTALQRESCILKRLKQHFQT